MSQEPVDENAAIQVQRTTSDHPDFIALARELSAYLAVINGENDSFYTQFSKLDTIPFVVVLSLNGVPVACGAFRPYAERTVEIKRMFVSPDHRGKGLAKRILSELETWALEESFEQAVLETSRRMTPAVSLYLRSGYVEIPNYPPYEDVTDSICLQKLLASKG
jgi:GNAT superfamily N-acetyltransferase